MGPSVQLELKGGVIQCVPTRRGCGRGKPAGANRNSRHRVRKNRIIMTQNSRTNKTPSGCRGDRSQTGRASFPVIPAVLVLGVLAVGAAYWLKKPAPPASSPGADTSQTAPPAASAPDDNLPVEVSGEVAPAP